MVSSTELYDQRIVTHRIVGDLRGPSTEEELRETILLEKWLENDQLRKLKGSFSKKTVCSQCGQSLSKGDNQAPQILLKLQEDRHPLQCLVSPYSMAYVLLMPDTNRPQHNA